MPDIQSVFLTALSPTDVKFLLREELESFFAAYPITQMQKQETDQWFDVPGLSNYLPDHPSEQTIYGWSSKNLIPKHKRGAKLYFRQSEIDRWLKGDYKDTSQANAKSETHLKTRKKKKAVK